MDDTMEALDDDELEDEADAEVEKVLFDLTDGKLGQAGAVGSELPVSPVCALLFASLRMETDYDHRFFPCRPRKKPKRTSIPRPRCSVCRKSCTTFSRASLRL